MLVLEAKVLNFFQGTGFAFLLCWVGHTLWAHVSNTLLRAMVQILVLLSLAARPGPMLGFLI